MLTEKKTNTNIGVGAGLLMQLTGNVIQGQGGPMVPLGLLLTLSGTGFFIWGCVQYCQGKGHSGWLGLLGLLSILGLLILIFLPDRYKGGHRPVRHSTYSSYTNQADTQDSTMFDTRRK